MTCHLFCQKSFKNQLKVINNKKAYKNILHLHISVFNIYLLDLFGGWLIIYDITILKYLGRYIEILWI